MCYVFGYRYSSATVYIYIYIIYIYHMTPQGLRSNGLGLICSFSLYILLPFVYYQLGHEMIPQSYRSVCFNFFLRLPHLQAPVVRWPIYNNASEVILHVFLLRSKPSKRCNQMQRKSGLSVNFRRRCHIIVYADGKVMCLQVPDWQSPAPHPCTNSTFNNHCKSWAASDHFLLTRFGFFSF